MSEWVNSGSRRKAVRQQVLITYGPVCHLCGQPIDPNLKYPDPMSFEVDHVVPLSLGGDPWDIDGLRPSHRLCNAQRGNRKYQQKTPVPTSRKW